MSTPAPDTPIPPAAHPIIERVHRRYVAACKRGERPAAALLTALECFALAQCGYYPIPPAVIRLGMTPAEHHRQQILDTVEERLAAQLPDAIMAVLETMEI